MRVVAEAAIDLVSALVQMFVAELGGLHVVARETERRNSVREQGFVRAGVRAVAIQAFTGRGRRMGILGIDREINSGVTRHAELSALCDEQFIVSALMRVVTVVAFSFGEWAMHGLCSLDGVGDVGMAFRAGGSSSLCEQSRIIRGVRDVAIGASAVHEGRMGFGAGKNLHHSGVTRLAERVVRCSEQLLIIAAVNIVTRRALAFQERLVNARSQEIIGERVMAFQAEMILRLREEIRGIGSVRIVATPAVFGLDGGVFHGFRQCLRNILVAVQAERGGRIFQKTLLDVAVSLVAIKATVLGGLMAVCEFGFGKFSGVAFAADLRVTIFDQCELL